MNHRIRARCLWLGLFALALAARAQNGPWVPDLGNGAYRNPVLFADYSDPDAIRVGEDFYLVSSSFHCTPGLPILHSRDLVNWTIIGHALPEQVPADHFSAVLHGQGVWAPAIRFHAGRYWIFYPDPDFGLYEVDAADPAGPWSAPVLVKPGRGLIDPCPFWDDDGRAYLIHGWALSRSGVNNQLTINRLAADSRSVTDAGTVVFKGASLGWITVEGPKLYKRGGYYYIFAPSGGVPTGFEGVLRSKSLYGPYEGRNVLDQGKTPINGPHQGAWVETASGQDWFLHFQDRGPFGRDVHLEPMAWNSDGWPVIGEDPGHTGKGQPVLTHRKPDVGATYPAATPQTSDEFDSAALGLQWQWQANPRADWASVVARPGFLRLFCRPAPAATREGLPEIYNAPNLLLQKFPAPAFTVTTKLEFTPGAGSACAGLVVFGFDYQWVGLQSGPAGLRLVWSQSGRAKAAQGAFGDSTVKAARATAAGAAAGPAGPALYLRVAVDAQGICRFSSSSDGGHFSPLGPAFQSTVDRWIGAKVGLFAVGESGHADFDWFRVTP